MLMMICSSILIKIGVIIQSTYIILDAVPKFLRSMLRMCDFIRVEIAEFVEGIRGK